MKGLQTLAENGASLARAPEQVPTILPPGYSVEVDSLDGLRWNEVLVRFEDANIYQTWAYEAERSGRRAMSHFILRKDGEVIAAAQLRVVKLPWLPIGVAYARWGPLWRQRGSVANPETLRLALRALQHEYGHRRGLSLRILPLAFDSERLTLDPLLASEGFECNPLETAQRTLLIDLDASLVELRKGLDQKWRNCLNRAEKNGLEVRSGTDDELFSRFVELYEQMHRRKGFSESSDVRAFQRVQRELPAEQRLRVSVAFRGAEAVAGVVCAGIGDMGVYLYGATCDAGMDTKASYLLQWQTLTWLKESGACSYNLHGINPETNPGTYHFKAGLCGKNGRDLRYLGLYDAGSPLVRGLIRRARRARAGLRSVRASLRLDRRST